MSAAIILAGGHSSRLGRDKASELLLGRSLLQHVVDRLQGVVDEYVIVRAAGQALPQIETGATVDIVEDAYPQIGPRGGVYTGLHALQAPHAITLACDMPLLQPALLAELLRVAPGHDAVVPLNRLPEPLCAVYAASCLPAIEQCIEAGSYKLTGFLEAVDVLYLNPESWRSFDPEGVSFLNVNREADLRRAETLLRRGAAP